MAWRRVVEVTKQLALTLNYNPNPSPLIGEDANTGVCCYVKVIRRAFSHAVREVLYRALTSETKSPTPEQFAGQLPCGR